MRTLYVSLFLAFAAPLVAEDFSSLRSRLNISSKDIDRRAPLRRSYADVVQPISKAVVSISITRQQNGGGSQDDALVYDNEPAPWSQTGMGSGVLVTKDGYILTNNHVIAEASEIRVMLPGNRKLFTGALIASDPSTDVALLKIEGDSFPAATLSDNKVRPGDLVFAVGNPYQLHSTVTQGIVSAVGRSNVSADSVEFANFIQTDANINPGNSGGALVDIEGRVVGINTLIFSNNGVNLGISFAVPISMALEVIQSLLDEGMVERGFLGVGLKDVTRAMAGRLGRSDLRGAIVTAVGEESPAAEAGLQPEDLIIAYNDKAVDDHTKLRLFVSESKPGSGARLKVIRGREEIEIAVTLDLREDAQSFVRPKAPRTSPVPREFDGATMVELTGEMRELLALDADVPGVMLTVVPPGSVLYEAGLIESNVILSVDGVEVGSPLDIGKVVQKNQDDFLILEVLAGGQIREVTLERTGFEKRSRPRARQGRQRNRRHMKEFPAITPNTRFQLVHRHSGSTVFKVRNKTVFK